MESTNLELKPCDPSCNPYLALGGLLATGLDGIARKLGPGEPALVDPDTIPPAEGERRGIRRLPASLAEALDALEQDAVRREALGPVLGKEYLAVKQSEVQGFEGRDVESRSSSTSTSTDASFPIPRGSRDHLSPPGRAQRRTTRVDRGRDYGTRRRGGHGSCPSARGALHSGHAGDARWEDAGPAWCPGGMLGTPYAPS